MTEAGPAKKHVFCSEGTVAGTGCKRLACALADRVLQLPALQLTARQYGEVELPDAAPATGPGALAGNLSRCKEDTARVFAVVVQT